MKVIHVALLVGTLVALAGCGGGGGGGNGDDSHNNGSGGTTGGTKLSLYGEQVKSGTPYLDEGSPSAGGSSLQDWNGWNPKASGTVLGKLFNPIIGKNECIHNLIQVLDSHIQMVNQFSGQWGVAGSYSQGNMNAVVDTEVGSINIPFLNAEFPGEVDRLVTVNVPGQELTINMAFAQNGTDQTVVEQYSIGSHESGVFLARMSGNRVQIWIAYVNDSKVQIMWESDKSENWFKISEATDASGGNWEVMGGGSASPSAGRMAFMARNNANNSSEDEYYLTITPDALEAGTAQTIFKASTNPPSPSADEILAFITSGNPECPEFFFVPKYPESLNDLAWNP